MLEGIEAIVFRTVGDQPTLWESVLPEQLQRVPEELARAAVLTDAYRAHPERFIRNPPEPPYLPTGSWINPPDQPEEATQ